MRDGTPLIKLERLLRQMHFQAEPELVMVTDYYEPKSEPEGAKHVSDHSAAYSHAVHVAEITVDTLTGEIKVDKVTVAQDVGRVINRMGLEGQVEGGIAIGLGYALSENMRLEEGMLKNPCFRDYKLITAPEMPPLDLHFIESHCAEGPVWRQGHLRVADDRHCAGHRQRAVQRDRGPHLQSADVAGNGRPRHPREAAAMRLGKVTGTRRETWRFERRMKLKYCAWLRDSMGCASEHIVLPNEVKNVGMLLDWLADPGRALRGRVRVHRCRAGLGQSPTCQIETIPCMTRTKSFWRRRSRAAERCATAWSSTIDYDTRPEDTFRHALEFPSLAEAA